MVLRTLRDTWLVAGFETRRALRSWQALALVVVHAIAHGAAAYLFIEAMGAIEREVAEGLAVPTTRWPGPLLEQVRDSEQLAGLIGGLVGDPDLVDVVLSWPLLAVFHLWAVLLFGPFLAATSASDAIAADVRSRAIRYEALRVGRVELVVGRFLGQIGLVAVASAVSAAVVWCLGMTLMVGQGPVSVGMGLASLALRGLAFTTPFVALGIACSSFGTSVAWTRVGALLLTAGSWVLYGLSRAPSDAPWLLLTDLLAPLLPQSWIHGLWAGGGEAVASALVLIALAFGMVGVAALRVTRRDL